MPQDALPPERPIDTTTTTPSKWRNKLWWLKKFLIFPLIGMIISAFILSRVAEWWTGPEAYQIFVAGDFSGHDQNSYLIWKGINDAFADKTIDGIPVQLERVDDSGSPNFARELSKELVKRADALMVVGHMSSSRSLEALPAYLRADPPVPVILPVETNPNLVPQQFFPGFMKEHLYNPIFLIAPNDNVQAATAAEFVIKKGANRVWVIKDNENSVYSEYLTNEFVVSLLRKKQTVIHQSSITELPSLDTIKKLGIDCIFYVGRWFNALVLLEQVHLLWSMESEDKMETKPPMVIMSDSVVNNELLELMKYTKLDLDEVYVTYPMSADQYQKEGHYGLGRDVGIILEDLIENTDLHFSEVMKEKNIMIYWFKWILNTHQVSDARHVLRLVMGNATSPPYHRFSGDKKEGEEYVFNNEGLRTNARFHIWKITKRDENSYISKKDEEGYIFMEYDLGDLIEDDF